MNDRIYPSMVIRSQSEAIELLEKENTRLQNNWNELKKWLEEVHNEENKYNFGSEDYAYNQVLCFMQELENRKV